MSIVFIKWRLWFQFRTTTRCRINSPHPPEHRVTCGVVVYSHSQSWILCISGCPFRKIFFVYSMASQYHKFTSPNDHLDPLHLWSIAVPRCELEGDAQRSKLPPNGSNILCFPIYWRFDSRDLYWTAPPAIHSIVDYSRAQKQRYHLLSCPTRNFEYGKRDRERGNERDGRTKTM